MTKKNYILLEMERLEALRKIDAFKVVVPSASKEIDEILHTVFTDREVQEARESQAYSSSIYY